MPILFKSQIDVLLNYLPSHRRRVEKNAMRQLLTQKRRVLSPEEVTERSAAIISRIEVMPEFRSAKVVLCYYPIHGEVDLRPLIEKYRDEKTILLPVAHRSSMEVRPYIGKEDLRKGRFGIPEPQTPAYTGKIDMVLVPGVAFDRKRRRLGRGGGYYDRFLRRYRHSLTVGVAYDFQMVKEVPVDIFDRPVDRIVSQTETIA